MGDYEKARFNYEKSLDINIKNNIGIGLCKQNLGSLAIKMNHLMQQKNWKGKTKNKI